MTERNIRRLKPEDMEDYIHIYLNAYPSGKNLSEETYKKFYDRNLQSLVEYDHVNFFGLFENGTLVAIMKLIDFQMNYFGELNKATGLMSLGVHPMHKKKGIARDMMKFYEDYTIESGGLVAMLLPFRVDFYRKMGYGYGTKLDEYRIPTSQLPESRELTKLRLVREDEIEKVLSCHSAFVKKYHGALQKFEEEIRDYYSDEETRRIGYFEGDELVGYVAFSFVGESAVNYTLNRIEVTELVYPSGAVLRSLLGGLRMQVDLAQNIVIRTGEADFYHLLDSPQDISGNYINYGFLQTNLSAMGTMYKVPDIKAFIEGTKYRSFPKDNLKVAIHVYNEFKSVEEHFSIRFSTENSESHGTWCYEEDWGSSDVEIKCSLADLSSLLVGSADLAPLVRMGVMSISDEGETDRLDRLFHYIQRPFTNTDY